MNTRQLTRRPLPAWLAASAAILLVLSACQPANVTTLVPPVEPTATALPTQPPAETQIPAEATQAPSTTPTSVETAQPPAEVTGEISLDLTGVADDQTVETIPAVPASTGSPIWDVLPQYRRVTLQGYPVNDHLMKPQIFIFPVPDLASFNEAAGQKAADLKALIQSRQPGEQLGEYLPFMPLFNAQQVMHAQVQYLDFKNGSGVRFLTQFDQAPLPINNFELIYTFQGLTSDGMYYIAAVLPVTHPDLPATQMVSTQQAEELNNFPTYLAETAAWLDQQPGNSFTPDLAKLDALIQSIEVK